MSVGAEGAAFGGDTAKSGQDDGQRGKRGVTREICRFAIVGLECMNVCVDKDRNKAQLFMHVTNLVCRREGVQHGTCCSCC